MLTGFGKKLRRILVVVKQTPYEQYLQMKNTGQAPVALRWARLKNRFELHQKCVEQVTGILNKLDVEYSVVGREEMHRGLTWDHDLIVSVGGDGTLLSTACFVDDSVPILGINSDPTRPAERFVRKEKDERRSRGALCAASANDVGSYLPSVISGEMSPGIRSRIQCIVKSTYTETRLPPALNDILVTHPSPAAVSRFRLTKKSLGSDYGAPHSKSAWGKTWEKRDDPRSDSTADQDNEDDQFSFNCWSSGMWVSTPTGSTAAMAAAGGYPMELESTSLQYLVREHLLSEEGDEAEREGGHGEIKDDGMLHVRWNSQFGSVFVDGSHTKHDLHLGDELSIEAVRRKENIVYLHIILSLIEF